MAAVEIVNISKHVGQTTIIDNISVSIPKGEFLVVVGPSGCGKSTLLRLVAGLEELTSGEIYMHNQCVNHVPPAKRDMAMVFQSYALYPHMTVFDNMAYGLKMRGVPKIEIQKKVAECAKLLRLTAYLHRKPNALSGGQKQRVAMGRAMVRSPSVFLYDEPLSNLDAKLRTEMRHEIKKLHQQFETTSLYVTHDQTEAMTMAERILVLNHGVVEQVGTPKELYQKPSSVFVAGFTGHYPINFIEGKVNARAKTIDTPLGIEMPLPHLSETISDNKAIILAIRPEHIVLTAKENPQAILVKVEFIDDMGADKMIQTRSIKGGFVINLRVPADWPLYSSEIAIAFPESKIHLFHKDSGIRIGMENVSHD